jgi:hypothetical protein
MTRSSVFGCQTDLGLGLHECDSQLEVQIVPCQMLDLALRIPVSRIVENSRRSSSRQGREELPDL